MKVFTKMSTHIICQTYDVASKAVRKLMKNDPRPIVLYGAGDNGKTHLIRELQRESTSENWSFFGDIKDGLSNFTLFECQSLDQIASANQPCSIVDMNSFFFNPRVRR